jgi:hypothetical protein
MFALGIAAEMLGEVTNPTLQRIARPEGERPKKKIKTTRDRFDYGFFFGTGSTCVWSDQGWQRPMRRTPK